MNEEGVALPACGNAGEGWFGWLDGGLTGWLGRELGRA